jgi:hypothetical protein
MPSPWRCWPAGRCCSTGSSRTGLREQEFGTDALVGTAPGDARRMLRARMAMAVGLAGAAIAPGLLHEAFAHPPMVPAAIVLGASLALWGLASASLTRSNRPYELVFLFVAIALAILFTRSVSAPTRPAAPALQ